MLPDYFYTACIPDGLQLYIVERQIKCTKKFKLNANKNDVKFNSIQFI